MCCRYYMEMSPELKPFVDAVRGTALLDRMVAQLGRPLVDAGEVRPTDIAVAVAPDRSGRRAAFPMIWGFTGPTSSLFNARVETAARKPLWKESWERRRCVIPASWYYEWEHFSSSDGRQKTGDRYAIQPKGRTLTLMAGLYRIEDGFPHFSILTREPGEELRFIHDRMPVILSPEAAGRWIDPALPADEIRQLAENSDRDMIFEKN